MDFLKLIWKKWLAVAHVIGNFQGQVILSLFYFVFIFPLGVAFKFLSNPLHIKLAIDPKKKTSFEKWEHPKETLAEARKQY